MKALTHSVFGVLMLLTSAALFGVSLQSPTLFFVVIGSLLPDIDTSSSWIGRLSGPLTKVIERHFGHRTLTHSIIGVVGFSGIVIPLYFFRPGWYFSLILGYISHLTADLFTKAGICLYFPEMSRAVIPGKADWRIEVGSRAESVFLAVLLMMGLGSAYLYSQGGVSLYLHRVFAQPRFAVEDYLSWCATYSVSASAVLVNNLTGQEFKGVFPIVGHIGERVLVGEIDSKLVAIGKSADANFYAKKISCQRGEPIQIIEQRIDLSNRLLGDLQADIDLTQEHYLFGTLALYQGVSLVEKPGTFRTITSSFRQLTFDHARWQELEEYQLQSVLVHRGELLVRTVHNVAQTAKSSSPSPQKSHLRDSQLSSKPPSTSARTANRLPTSATSNQTQRRTKRRMVYTVHRVKRLFVNRLNFVQAGQPIAEVYRKHTQQDTTLLRLRLATEKKLLKLARQQIDASIQLIDDEKEDFRKAYEKLLMQASVFSNHAEKAEQLWKKIHKHASNKAQLLAKRQVEGEKHTLKIAQLTHEIEKAQQTPATKTIRAQTDGVVALIEKQVTDQTITAIISIVTEEQAPPVYGHRKIARHGQGKE